MIKLEIPLDLCLNISKTQTFSLIPQQCLFLKNVSEIIVLYTTDIKSRRFETVDWCNGEIFPNLSARMIVA